MSAGGGVVDEVDDVAGGEPGTGPSHEEEEESLLEEDVDEDGEPI